MRHLSILVLIAIVFSLGGGGNVAAQEEPPAVSSEPGFVSLFDGTEASFAAWEVVGENGFRLENGTIVASPIGEDIALLYYAPRPFGDFILRLQFRLTAPADNSGVYVRFRDPRQPLSRADLDAPGAAATFLHRSDYSNASWMAVDTGFEVQIDEAAAGDAPGLDQHRTGAIYDIPLGTELGEQAYQRGPALRPGVWNDLEMTVSGQTYSVAINGHPVTTFTNPNPLRGTAPETDAASGYIGVQSHPFIAGQVDFRNIRIRELPPSDLAATPIAG